MCYDHQNCYFCAICAAIFWKTELTGKSGASFAVRMHTAKDIWSALPCAYARQRRRQIFACPGSLPCGQERGARQRNLCRAGLHGKGNSHGTVTAHGNATLHGSGQAHGKGCCTAKHCGARQRNVARQCLTAHGKGLGARQRRCRAVLAWRTAMIPLPGRTLPSGLCRAVPHGKAFAEQIWAFAVQTGCTATSSSPVVHAKPSPAVTCVVGRSRAPPKLRQQTSYVVL